MTDNISELVKRLNAGRTLLLHADGDRDLGFQSNITTDTSMALADELKSAADALEAQAAEVKKYKKEWMAEISASIDLATLAAERRVKLEAAEAKVERLRAALEGIAVNADAATDLPLFRVQVRDFARKALEEK